MSLQSGGLATQQQSVISQLQELKKTGPDDISNYASKKLEAWEGRTISSNEVSETFETISSMVEEHLLSKDLSESQVVPLKENVSALQKAAEGFQRITGVVSQPLGLESKSVKLEDVLAKIDEKEMANHPAFRENLSEEVAEHALKLGSVPVGSYVIVKSEDEFRVLVKDGRDSVSAHDLSEGEEGGFTISEGYDSDAGYESDDEVSVTPQKTVEKEPPPPPKVLSDLVTPMPPISNEMRSLLTLQNKLGGVQFSQWGRRGPAWNELGTQTKLIPKSSNRPQQLDPNLLLQSAVDVINLHPDSAMQVKRKGKNVFFHGNTVEVEGQKFNCHQLPGEHSRDNLWLSLWDDAGKGGGKATIVKLSTPGCRQACDPPILRKYWPVSKSDSEVKDFQSNCQAALEKLKQGRATQRLQSKVQGLQDRADKFQAKKGKLELEKQEREAQIASYEGEPPGLEDLKGKLEEVERGIGEAQQDVDRYTADIKDTTAQLDCLTEAFATQTKYIEEQLRSFQADEPNSGANVGQLTTQDKITVKLASEETLEGFPGAVIRRFSLTKEGSDDTRNVTQIDYPGWADYSTSSAGNLVSLRNVYKKEHGANPTPVYFHCRAGVGRTGTFIAFDASMSQIEKAAEQGKLSEIDPQKMVTDIIVKIRSQRDWQMVRQPVQAQQIVDSISLALMGMIQKADQ